MVTHRKNGLREEQKEIRGRTRDQMKRLTVEYSNSSLLLQHAFFKTHAIRFFVFRVPLSSHWGSSSHSHVESNRERREAKEEPIPVAA